MENVFGPGTQLGKKITLHYPILNNSMTSAWHPHPMLHSSPILYGNLIMPYLVKDWLSDKIDQYFTLNNNEIPLIFSEVDLDKQGQLNSARLYSYPCINLNVSRKMLQEYPHIDYQELQKRTTHQPGNIIKYCTSLGAWRGTMLQINGQVIDGYTPNVYCQTGDDCANSLFCSSQACTKKYQQLLTHDITSNLLRIHLVNASCSFRRSYMGLVDSDNNFLDFWVIASGGGFCLPWKTKMVSLESMNRNQILVDFLDYNISEIYLVAFDFDITLMEKVIPYQPYQKDPDPKYNRNFFDRFSIYTGCLVDIDDYQRGDPNIFDNPECQATFLDLLNKLRNCDNQTTTIPFLKAIRFNYRQHGHVKARSQDVLKLIREPLTHNPEGYYFNYPGPKIAKRKITMSSGMQFQVDSWFNYWDQPSLKFKFSEDSEYSNLQMISNIHLTVQQINPDDNEVIAVKKINFPVTPMDEILNIDQLTEIINMTFKQNNISLQYSYHKRAVNVNGVVDINSVFIRLHNTSTFDHYRIIGNNNIMQFMGIELKWGSSDINVKDPRKTDLSLFLSGTENPQFVSLQDNPNMPTMAMVKLLLPPKKFHEGNPFQVMNDNIMNFTVKKDTTETWIFYNTDNEFFDNHPFHFHLTTGFVNKAESSPINCDPILTGSIDVVSIKVGTHLGLDIKFSNFSSFDGDGIKNLGYMFHCHYMMHHDMNMMGQFYIEPDRVATNTMLAKPPKQPCRNPRCRCIDCQCGENCLCGLGHNPTNLSDALLEVTKPTGCQNPLCRCVNCQCGPNCRCGRC